MHCTSPCTLKNQDGYVLGPVFFKTKTVSPSKLGHLRLQRVLQRVFKIWWMLIATDECCKRLQKYAPPPNLGDTLHWVMVITFKWLWTFTSVSLSFHWDTLIKFVCSWHHSHVNVGTYIHWNITNRKWFSSHSLSPGISGACKRTYKSGLTVSFAPAYWVAPHQLQSRTDRCVGYWIKHRLNGLHSPPFPPCATGI